VFTGLRIPEHVKLDNGAIVHGGFLLLFGLHELV
jgi:hypothetical protein